MLSLDSIIRRLLETMEGRWSDTERTGRVQEETVRKSDCDGGSMWSL